jgi:diaminopimelate epimerase
MRFTKMHGAGNDYVYVNCFDEAIPSDIAAAAKFVSDRHFGIGGDGLVLILPSDKADARMRMFNADGSEAEMCGNAIRCVAKYVYDHGVKKSDSLTIETGTGVLSLELELEGGLVQRARVDMGLPILDAQSVPTLLPGDPSIATPFPVEGGAVVNVPLEVEGLDSPLLATCVSMGNPHCVVFVEELSDYWVHEIGPRIEQHPAFPNKVNAEFVEVVSPHELNMRVWERGSGETWACGTGASAVGVAGVLTGRTERKTLIHLLGGDLEIEWADDQHVFKTGPAVEVFSGDIDLGSV